MADSLQVLHSRKGVDYLLGVKFIIEKINKNLKFPKIYCVKDLGTEYAYHVIAEKNNHLIPLLTPKMKEAFTEEIIDLDK